MAVGNQYRLITYGYTSGEECLNVFHYRHSTSTGSNPNLQGIITSFVNSVLEQINDVLSASFSWDKVIIQNLSNVSEYLDLNLSPNINGQIAEDPMPSFVNVTYKAVRPYPPLRHGYKRFAGVPEGQVAGNSPSAGYLTLLENRALALAATLTDSAGNTYVPIIRYAVGGGYSDYQASDWRFARVGTQNTRK